MASEPKIYTRNYVDENCSIVSSHGGETDRLFDRDYESEWLTSGADSDEEEVIVQIDFFEAGNEIERTIDRIIMLGHNLYNPEFQYWNGSDWITLVSGVNLTDSTTILSFTQVTTQKVRLIISDTQSADNEKEMAEIIICALSLDVGIDMTDYSVNYRQKASEIELLDGSIHRTVIKHSPNRTQQYESRFHFKYVSEDTLASLKSIKEIGAAFLWQPESITRPSEIFYVNWTGPFSYKYSSTYKGAGFEVDVALKEV